MLCIIVYKLKFRDGCIASAMDPLLSYSVRSQEGNLSGQQSYPSVLFILNDVA